MAGKKEAKWRRWEPWEDETIKRLYKTTTYKELAKMFGVNRFHIQTRIKKLRLGKYEQMKFKVIERPKWEYSNRDVTKLIDYYANLKTA